MSLPVPFPQKLLPVPNNTGYWVTRVRLVRDILDIPETLMFCWIIQFVIRRSISCRAQTLWRMSEHFVILNKTNIRDELCFTKNLLIRNTLAKFDIQLWMFTNSQITFNDILMRAGPGKSVRWRSLRFRHKISQTLVIEDSEFHWQTLHIYKI